MSTLNPPEKENRARRRQRTPPVAFAHGDLIRAEHPPALSPDFVRRPAPGGPLQTAEQTAAPYRRASASGATPRQRCAVTDRLEFLRQMSTNASSSYAGRWRPSAGRAGRSGAASGRCESCGTCSPRAARRGEAGGGAAPAISNTRLKEHRHGQT